MSDGETVSLALLYEEPDFYCPDCRRLLVHVYDDGRFDIAAKSELVSEAHIDLDEGIATALVVDAICEMRRCRLRRFLRRFLREPEPQVPPRLFRLGAVVGLTVVVALALR